MASLFVIDTAGDQPQDADVDGGHSSVAIYNNAFSDRLLSANNSGSDDEEEEVQEIELFGVKVNNKDVRKVVKSRANETTLAAPSKVAVRLTELAEQINEAVENSDTHKMSKRKKITDLHYDTSESQKERKANVELDMKKTVLTGEFAQSKALPTVSRRKQPLLNRAERAKTKGGGWFDMPATEITEDMRNELKIIQMRSVLDPKHFYKKNDLKVLPKYFQIGTVQHSPLDHYSERHTRKTKKSLVDELLADEEFQKFNKRKYKEVIKRTDKYAHRKAMKKMKKLKKNK
ncbi:deoxynucleotidyltransferase terminal-interacting protein 2 [Drosophila nasuta]|uniref:Deoxynucleotidyltransferase terminal-interacting protein 2 n=1 Tax=Drosophila albomicans TaxID=7291 RepID=A0A6P8XSH2_DROAB|nr:deoxynucleotidyltransferase terminal-interacting protein 2 [Drosophila albomicans]XP_060651312.1 deoxynucleotidyltransferase terminal-interacting protein 2 [Drosophila nasuta]